MYKICVNTPRAADFELIFGGIFSAENPRAARAEAAIRAGDACVGAHAEVCSCVPTDVPIPMMSVAFNPFLVLHLKVMGAVLQRVQLQLQSMLRCIILVCVWFLPCVAELVL